MFHKAKIKLDGRGMGSVELDGVEVKGVQSVALESTVMEPPILTLRMFVGEVEAETDAIPQKTHDFRP